VLKHYFKRVATNTTFFDHPMFLALYDLVNDVRNVPLNMITVDRTYPHPSFYPQVTVRKGGIGKGGHEPE